MENEKNVPVEEQAKLPQEEDVRENIITEFGFDEDTDSDRIDRLVEKEMDNSKKLSDAIGQKIKHRDRVKELESNVVRTYTDEMSDKNGDFKKKAEGYAKKIGGSTREA